VALACLSYASGVAASGLNADAMRWTALSDMVFTTNSAPEAGAGTSIAQDRDGFIWIGTEGGLARWDGYHLRRYTADPRKAGSLTDSFILTLHVDPQGALWVGTNSGGLARYVPERDAFDVTGGAVLGHTSVLSIADDTGGALWVGTAKGLYHIDAGVAAQATAVKRGLPEGRVQALLSDRSGGLWAGTQHGLWRQERGDSSFSALSLGLPDAVIPDVTSLFQDSEDRIWVATQAHGAFVLEAGVTRAVHESGAVSTLQNESVTSIEEALPGEVWLGTEGGGIVALDTRSGTTRRIRHSADTSTSLSDNNIAALFRDKSNLMWVATDQATSQGDPRQRGLVMLLGATGRANGLRGTNVYSILRMPDGHIWLSGDDGIDIVDPTLGRIAQLLPDLGHPDTALPRGRIRAMVVDGSGQVYIGTPQGLYCSDSDGQHVMRLKVPGRSPSSPIGALYLEGRVLWIGGLVDGLWAVDLTSANERVLLNHIDGARLGDPRVTTIERGTGDALWVGTRGGLVLVDKVSGTSERVPSDATDPTQLPGGYVSSTLVDRRGRLWVASFGAGVQMLERHAADGGWRFRRFGVDEGLPHAGVDKLLEDAQGNIWAGTDDGLAVIDPSTLAIHSYQRPDGVGVHSFWMNSGAATEAGELLFGGTGGLAVVRPELLRRWAYQPPVVITHVRTGTLSLPVGRFNHARGQSDPLEISSDDRDLRVEFSALDYSAPERNRYAYRLLGFDADWIASEPSLRLASYTNLPPGSYTLEVRGSNRNGDWTQPLRIPIKVQAAWYQTLWCRLALTFLALAVVIALVQVRTVYLRRRQHELEALVSERTAELEARGRELRDSQLQLEKMAYNDPLTGLANRRFFENDLRHYLAMSQRDGSGFTLLLIDLDGFKKINDRLGHDAGDALLVETALRLTQAVRTTDRVARLGGDEFAVILTHTCELEAVQIICRRIMASLSAPMMFKGAPMQVSASIGSAQGPGQGCASDVLYKAADVALYDAKRRGRNAWCWYGQAAAERNSNDSLTV
jgi:diguanylate cyclase (GGDEF)-like protein